MVLFCFISTIQSILILINNFDLSFYSTKFIAKTKKGTMPYINQSDHYTLTFYLIFPITNYSLNLRRTIFVLYEFEKSNDFPQRTKLSSARKVEENHMFIKLIKHVLTCWYHYKCMFYLGN